MRRPPRPLPGAQQLELLRRLNLASGSSARPRGGHDRDRTRLADRVLATPAAGRGKADLPLLGLPHHGFGAGPVDPSTIGPHELLRVASVLLADDLVALGADPVATSLGAAVAATLPAGRRSRRDRRAARAPGRARPSRGWAAPLRRRGRAPARRAARPHLDPALLRDRRDAVGRVAAVLARARPAARPRRPRRVRTPLARAPALRPGRHRPRPAAPPGRRTVAALGAGAGCGPGRARPPHRCGGGPPGPRPRATGADADAAAADPRQRRRARRRTRRASGTGWRRPRRAPSAA